MIEGDIEICMYRMAARHFRLPVRLLAGAVERVPFLPRAEEDSYVILDDLEQRLGVMKVFTADGKEEELVVEKTIEGIRAISSLGLKESEPSTPRDFARAPIETLSAHYIALFTFPEGKTLLTHILYLVKQKESSLERRQAFEILKNAYIQQALAFGELHTKGYSPICTISVYYWTLHMDTCRSIIKSLRGYAESIPFDLNDFSEKLVRMAAAAYANPCSAGFLHGNPTIGSVAYEPFSGVLSLLDLEHSYHSIDESGAPCGPCAYDFVWAEASFLLEMVYLGAPYDEVHDILYEYHLKYKNIMRDRYPSEQHLTFYNVLFWLPIYKSLLAKYQGDESAMEEADKRVFLESSQKIAPVLKFSSSKTENAAG